MEKISFYTDNRKNKKVFERRVRKPLFFFLFSLFVLDLLFFFVSTTEFLWLKRVDLPRSSLTDLKLEALVWKKASSFPFTPYLYFSLSKSDLRNPGFSDISLSWSLDTLKIDYSWKEIIGCAKAKGLCYLVDKELDVIDTAPELVQAGIIFEGFDPKLRESLLGEKSDKILFLLRELQEFYPRVVRKEDDVVQIFTRQGFYLVFDLEGNLDAQVANFRILWKNRIGKNPSNLEYVDLRFPPRAFYKLRSTP